MSGHLSGSLVAVEGIDGVGKSTLVSELARRLSDAGTGVEVVDFPVYDEPTFGPLIGRFLRGELGGHSTIDPHILAMLFAGNRAALRDDIAVMREAGRIVLCDRWVYSNIAFQGAKLDDCEWEPFVAWVERVEYDLFSLPRADLTVWLDLPTAARSVNRAERAYLNGAVDVHESNSQLQTEVAARYAVLAGERKDILHVEAIDPDGRRISPAALASQVLGRLRREAGERALA